MIELGDYQVLPLADRPFRLDAGSMLGALPRPLWPREVAVDSANRMELATRPMLVSRGTIRVLVDTGLGTKHSAKVRGHLAIPEGPGLLARLEEAGVHPDSISVVAMTHLHMDHAGYLTRRDERGRLVPTFPRARVVVQRGEWEEATAPEGGGRGWYVTDDLLPLAEAGRVELLDGPAEILPGLFLEPTGGHTRHHQLVRVAAGGRTLVYPADILPTRHHLHLRTIMAYDDHAADTHARKRELLERAAAEGWLVAFDHDPDLAVARVEPARGGFRAVPVT